ncbi:hypothetical protein Daus18300_004196, partial [Diaporthe australafricana]
MATSSAKTARNTVAEYTGQYELEKARIYPGDTAAKAAREALIKELSDHEHTVWSSGNAKLPLPVGAEETWAPYPPPSESDLREPKSKDDEGLTIREQQAELRRHDQHNIKGSAVLCSWDNSNLSANFVASYLQFNTMQQLNLYCLVEGVNMMQPFYDMLKRDGLTQKRLMTAEIADALSQLPHKTFDEQMEKVRQDPGLEPRFLNQSMPDGLKEGSGNPVSVRATVIAYVYRLLTRMTKGADFAPRDGQYKSKWDAYRSQHGSANDKQGVKLMRINFDDKGYRFVRKYEEDGTTPLDNAQFYFGYDIEDWNRAWVLFNWIRQKRNQPWSMMKVTREVKHMKLYWVDPDKPETGRSKRFLREDEAMAKPAAYNNDMRGLRLRAQDAELEAGSEHEQLARKLSTKSSHLQDENANDNIRVIARFFEQNAAFLRTSVSKINKPKPVQEVSKLWEAVHAHLAPKFPLPRGVDIDDFQPNKHIPEVGTHLIRPDGPRILPLGHLGRLSIRTIEVFHSNHCDDADKLASITDILMSHQSHPLSQDGRERDCKLRKNLGINSASDMYSYAFRIDDCQAKQPMPMAVHRVNSGISTDFSMYRLFFDREVIKQDPLHAMTESQCTALGLVARGYSLEQAVGEAERIEEGKEKAAHGSRLELQEVHRLASMDPGALNWHYNCLAPYRFAPPVQDDVHMIAWALSYSPVMFWGIDKIMTQLNNPDKFGSRTLVLVDSHYAQFSLHGILVRMGLSVMSYTSDLSEEARSNLVADFNKPNKRCDVMILSTELNNAGINMQKACSHGVCMSFMWNPSALMQALCRIYRVGQIKNVYWSLMKQASSYNELQETVVHDKQAELFSAQVRVPGQIQGMLRSILCYELARETWGTIESKFVFSRFSYLMKSVADYSLPWLKRYAKYYSILAGLYFSIAPDMDASPAEHAQQLHVVLESSDYKVIDENINPNTVTWAKVAEDIDKITEEAHNLTGSHTVIQLYDHYSKKIASLRPWEKDDKLRKIDLCFTPPKTFAQEFREGPSMDDFLNSTRAFGDCDDSEVDDDSMEPGNVYRFISDKGDMLYELLGVNKNAGKQLLKMALRMKILKYHSDKYNLERLKIGEERAEYILRYYDTARLILLDTERKAKYDRGQRISEILYNSQKSDDGQFLVAVDSRGSKRKRISLAAGLDDEEDGDEHDGGSARMGLSERQVKSGLTSRQKK